MKAYKLTGTSMSPLFKAGEVALAAAAGLKRGDCAVYDLKGSKLLHRVIRTEEKGAWFSDDACRLAPHFVPWENIEGKVLSSNPLKKGRIGLAYSKLRRLAISLCPRT